jgi:drug/metabolite transporter (DMT)-like permease
MIIDYFISKFALDMQKERFNSSIIFAHIVAFITVAIWGTTFVSTKVLIFNGLSPAQIFVFRFLLAYVAIWIFGPKRLFSDHIRDELIFLVLGITGGSLYFMTENMALCYSTASNVSLIVCICPLITTLLLSIFYHSEWLTRIQWIGSLIACGGMVLVVLNGHFVLHLSPLGDTFAFGAAFCWAFYSLFVKNISHRYPSVFITRKLFFYGLITILPYFIFVPGLPSLDVIMRPQVYGNILFLGIVASMICYITWNWCIVHLGAVHATNYIYFNPLMTILFAWMILGERITVFIISGAVMILFGMYLAERRKIF